MARRRRKLGWLSGLGGSVESHVGNAVSSFSRAAKKYTNAADEASHGRCSIAFQDMMNGQMAAGAADAHRGEVIDGGGSDSARKRLTDLSMAAYSAEKNAMREFRTHCMVGKGMSGLGMRRRKSRR